MQIVHLGEDSGFASGRVRASEKICGIRMDTLPRRAAPNPPHYAILIPCPLPVHWHWSWVTLLHTAKSGCWLGLLQHWNLAAGCNGIPLMVSILFEWHRVVSKCHNISWHQVVCLMYLLSAERYRYIYIHTCIYSYSLYLYFAVIRRAVLLLHSAPQGHRSYAWRRELSRCGQWWVEQV